MNTSRLVTVIRDNWTSLINLHVSLLFLNPLKMSRTPQLNITFPPAKYCIFFVFARISVI